MPTSCRRSPAPDTPPLHPLPHKSGDIINRAPALSRSTKIRRALPTPSGRAPDLGRASPLSQAERAEIHRQGAKAAARGESACSNPLEQARNQPAATGESAEMWRQRRAAWARGHAVQTLARRAQAVAVLHESR